MNKMKKWLLAGLGAAGLLVSGTALARVDIGVSIGVPGVIMGGPAYVAPPVYVAPAPVYVAPPVYYAPHPVYVRPPVVYRPAPVYYGPRYHGHGPRGHYRNNHHHHHRH